MTYSGDSSKKRVKLLRSVDSDESVGHYVDSDFVTNSF